MEMLLHGKLTINLALLALCLVLSFESIQSLKYNYVTWSSTIKLLNLNSNSRLHSHDVKYGSGSGQQSVTAVKSADDHNSYWQIRPKAHHFKERGAPVRCDDVIRLTHLATKHNLHSHLFQSPLSNNQEVSAFGDLGEGDDGDNWIVECDDQFWRRDESVRLKHEATGKYLHVTGDSFGRPIHGQLEVCSYPYPNQLNLWRALEGVFIKPSEQQQAATSQESAHSEL